ncbi:MAG TPA: PAS domain S-box protein [Tepidisphaeraceae bacterium]|jgi:PAS domain S-box-containing protein|nr:PAS domain S-box protein [Tepidisphaeraceae bacterium]
MSVSEERLMAIIGSATDAIITIDEAQKITLFNSAAERMFRCPANEAVGQPIERFIPQRFRGIHSEHIRVFAETGVTTRAMGAQRPLAALRADGMEFPVEATISQGTAGGEKLFTVIIRDISERRGAEEALRKSEESFRLLVDGVQEYAILMLDRDGRVASWNAGAERIKGYKAEEIIGKNFSIFYPPDEAATGKPAVELNEAAETGRCEDEAWRVRKDGTRFWASVLITALRDEAGELRGFSKVTRDISARREAEQALRESEGRLRAIVETAVDAIITIDEDGAVSTFNPAAMRLFGYAPEEVIGKNVNLLMPAPYHAEHDGYLRNYMTSGVKKIIGIGREVTGRRKDGTPFPMELAVSETLLGNRRIFTGIVRDISERKRAEQDLARQAEELARSNVELERFAYVASHDLQEPIRTVQSFTQLLQRRCGEAIKGDGEEYMQFIVGGVQRMQTLISDLLSYSRVNSQGAAFARADCKEIISRVLGNLAASIQSKGAEVAVEPLPVVMGDATQLGQLFQNLLGNALKFHGKRPPRLRVAAREKAGEWVFSVQDNGIGIAREYFERIFIIFQRLHTIEEYGGTGIGLAICKKIVERHGGRIWLESIVGEGTTFYFSIPKKERPE